MSDHLMRPWPQEGSRWIDSAGRVHVVTGVQPIEGAEWAKIASRCMIHVTRPGAEPHIFDWWPELSFRLSFTPVSP